MYVNFQCYIRCIKDLLGFTISNPSVWPVPVAARSKEWVCVRSPAETVGSHPTGGMDVCLL